MFSKKSSSSSKKAQEAVAREKELKEQLARKKQADKERKERKERRKQLEEELSSKSKGKGKAKEIVDTSPPQPPQPEILPEELPEPPSEKSPEPSSSSSSTSSVYESDQESDDSAEDKSDTDKRPSSIHRKSSPNQPGPSEPPRPVKSDNPDSSKPQNPRNSPEQPGRRNSSPPPPEPPGSPELSPSSPLGHPTMSAIKVPKPTTYSGQGDDRTLANLLDWIDGLENYILVNKGTVEKDGLLTASCYLSKAAKIWYRAWKSKNAQGTYDQFKKAIQKAFIPSTSDDILQAKWESLSQLKDGKTRPITNVAAELQNLALQLPEISDFTMKQRLFGAMTPELRSRVQPQIKETDKWDDIVTLAERFDAAMFQAKKLSTSSSGSSPSKSNRKSFQRSPNHHHKGNGNSNSSSSSSSSPRKPFTKTFTKLTPEIREKLIKEGKCLYCREPGHKVADCPKKPKISSSATSILFPKPSPPSSSPISSAMVTAKYPLRKPFRACPHHEPVQPRVQIPPPAPTPPPSLPPQSVSSASSEEEIKQHNYEHGKYSWTACYENSCPIHYTDKIGSGYYPRKPKRNDQIPQYIGKDPWDSEVQPSTGKEDFSKNTSYDDLFPPLLTLHKIPVTRRILIRNLNRQLTRL